MLIRTAYSFAGIVFFAFLHILYYKSTQENVFGSNILVYLFWPLVVTLKLVIFVVGCAKLSEVGQKTAKTVYRALARTSDFPTQFEVR